MDYCKVKGLIYIYIYSDGIYGNKRYNSSDCRWKCMHRGPCTSAQDFLEDQVNRYDEKEQFVVVCLFNPYIFAWN